jgi:glycosyltransferase involved in cell wall biosynthesis
MATYNGASYISQQLKSIVDQTYPNLEIIITDDASSDGTLAILQDFKNRYNNIKVLINPVNLGITSTFERSIKNCSGDYIAISDQDDIWDPNKVEILMKCLENEDAIYSDSELVDKNGQSLHKLISSLVNLKSFHTGTAYLVGVCPPGHTMLIQGDFAKYILPIPKSILYDRWISFCAAANNGIKFLDMPLVKYRQHETNSFGVGKSRNRTVRQSKEERFHAKLLELKAYENAPIKNTETKILLGEMLAHFNRNMSLARSYFFFKNRNKLLVIKKKNRIRKILFCLKMIFKANY